MTRNLTILAGGFAAAFATAFLGALIGRGSMLHAFVVIPAALLFLALLVLSSFWGLEVLARRSSGRAVAREVRSIVWMLSLTFVVAGVVASPFVGILLRKFDVARAKRFGEEMLPLLERYREEHGAYPDSLSDITDVSRAPRLVREGELTYRHYWRGYEFELSVAQGFGIAGWNLSSSDRQWRYWED